MSNGYIKSVGKTAADMAKQAARQIAREPIEILKQTSSVAGVGQEKNESFPIPPAIRTSGQAAVPSPLDVQKLESETRKRIQELEEEMRKIGQERKMKEAEWEKQQDQLLNPPEESSPKQAMQEPTPRRRRGFMGMVKKKQGTKEMGKTASG